MGILIFACLTGGSRPWKLADSVRDSGFSHYCDWLKRRSMKTPLAFNPFSSRLTRLLKRMLEPKPTNRCKITEVTKYLKDDWLSTGTKSTVTLLGSGSGTEKSPSVTGQVLRSNSDVTGGKKSGLGSGCRRSNASMCLKRRSERVKVRGRLNTNANTNDQCIEKKEPTFRMFCSFQYKNQTINQP